MRYMDAEKKQRRQSLKVLFSEAVMVLAVIISVVVLALVVSGYWINSDFKVERQGMLQIASLPTGAEVNIDGDTAWLQRTDTSKVLPSGEHSIVLSKEGYDSWSKTINIKEGLLYRIHYPRLFLNNRTPEKQIKLDGVTKTLISPDYNSVVLINGTAKWQLLNLREEKPTSSKIDISKVFSGVSFTKDAKDGIFSDKILDANWDRDASHILFKVRTKEGDKIEWILFDVKNPEKSLNLTKEFSSDFDTIKILDNSSNTLMAIQSGNLRKIDVSARSISAVLAKNVIDFDHYFNEIVFTAKQPSHPDQPYYIGSLKTNDTKAKELFSTASMAQAVVSQFYDQEYYSLLEGNHLEVFTKDDLEEKAKYDLSFTPDHIKVGHNGEFIIMYKGSQIASLDMEAGAVREWQVEGKTFAWLDNDMIYTVKDGELIVYDYDGYNRRVLAKNVSDSFSVGITDNKWLYYFSDNYLMREWIVEH